MVLLFNQPKTKTKQGTPGDTGVVSPATPAASASTVGTAATQSQPTENGGNPATTQPQQTATADQTAPQTTRRPLSNEYIQMKAQFDYDKAHPMKFESNLPKPDERTPVGDVYEPEEVVDFTNPKFAQKPAEFTPNIPGAEKGERQMRYIGPYDEGTYNYLGLQADMGNIPEAAIYQDAFDQVYGNKPGFVATDDRDGGFLEWARNVVDPEELRKAQKENKTRMGIIALADALRHFGNIYHTTKGAPAQTLTNATEKEYARQQQEEQLAIERLQKQYESEMKRLDLQYKRAMEEQRYKDSQEIKRMQLELQKSQQEALERYREQQQKNWEDKFDADQEYRAGQQDLAQQRIYLSGGRGGGSRGGGGRRSGGGRTVRGGGGKYRVSGGGGKGGSKGPDGGEVKYTFEVPDSIARKQGDKDAYVEEAYKSLVRAGYATAGKRSIATKKEEIEKQLHDPAVRETLQLAGFTVYENGAVAAGRDKISRRWNGGGQATGGRVGSGSTAASGGAAARGAGNGNGQTGRTGGTPGRAATGGKPQPAGSTSKGRGAARDSSQWVYTATKEAQGVYNRGGSGGGNKGGAKGGTGGGRGGSGSGSGGTAAYGGNASSRGGVTSRGGASRARDIRPNPTYSIEGSGVSIHIPLRVSNVKTGKRDTQVPLNTLEKVYNAGVKRGLIGAGARTYSDMVDAIYDNIDNIHVARMLDNLGIEMTEDDAMDYGIGSYQPQAQGWDYMYDGEDEGWSGPTPGRSAQERWE